MAKLLKLRRGTDTQHSTFTGAEGEVTVNTTNDSLHVHDGSTAGGTELAKADLSNAAGASIPGTLNTNRLVVDDDGSASPNAVFKTDDQSPWAVAIKNDTYSTTETHGLMFHQENAGDVYIRNAGNGAYENTWLQHHDGTNTRNMIRLDADGSVDLYHQNSRKLETTSTGIDVTGTVTCDGLTVDGNFSQSNGVGLLSVKDNDNTGTSTQAYIRGLDSADTEKWQIGHSSSSNDTLYVLNGSNGNIALGTNGYSRVEVTNAGHLVPATDDTYDLGASTQQWRNGYFDGTVNCDGLTCEGTATITSGNGVFFLKDSNSTGTGTQCYISGRDSANSEVWYVGQTSTGSAAVDIVNTQNSDILFGTNNSYRSYISSNGHYVPYANNTYDLGTSSNRWRNLYTNDLNLSNEGSTNDVDGTWGSWTIQEGEDDLFLLNRRNGKKYKFNLSEVN